MTDTDRAILIADLRRIARDPQGWVANAPAEVRRVCGCAANLLAVPLNQAALVSP